jgi:hypothetical protein
MYTHLIELTANSQLITLIAAEVHQCAGTASPITVQEELEATMGVEFWGSTPCHKIQTLLRLWAGKNHRSVFQHVFVTFSIEHISKINLELLRRTSAQMSGICTITPEHFWETPPCDYDFTGSIESNEAFKMRAVEIVQSCVTFQKMLTAQCTTSQSCSSLEPICGCVNCLITCDLATVIDLIAQRKSQLKMLKNLLQSLGQQLIDTAEWLRAFIS